MIPWIAMTKSELHRLVDALPDESLDAAAVLVRAIPSSPSWTPRPTTTRS
jgi:hypothetical protein